MPTTHTIETITHGRYLVERRESQRLLVGFHGYAETAERHMEELRRIDPGEEWTLVAVQALNRFYTRTEEVVANWMTRQDRELAIADNIEYVRRVVAALGPYQRLVFAGFSQGAAMAYRAAATLGADGLIILGGDIPPDVDTVRVPVLLGRGERDDWYTEEKLKKDLKSLPNATVCRFDGGHEWIDAFRSAARAFLRRLKDEG